MEFKQYKTQIIEYKYILKNTNKKKILDRNGKIAKYK